MRIAAITTLISLAAVLAACAIPGSLAPGTSFAEVRAKAGIPTDIRFDRNGDELWEYAYGPSGTETQLLRFGIDGKLKEVTQILTDDQLMKIVPGKMTKADVRDLLGRPSETSFTGAGTVWSWRFQRAAAPGWLTVRFNPDNTVMERIAILDVTGGRSREK